MINPAEDIVNIWLQSANITFTMNNVVVRKENKKIGNKLIGGGRKGEIDIISTNGKILLDRNLGIGKSTFRKKKCPIREERKHGYPKIHHSKKENI